MSDSMDSAAESGSVSQPLPDNATLPTAPRDDFEALLIEEGERPFVMAYSSPIERVFREIGAYDRATGIPIRPWVIGECCDHIYPTCPAVVRTGRLDANDNKWWLGTYATVDDPDNMLWLDPEWDNPNGDICGWCFRVWRGRTKRQLAKGEARGIKKHLILPYLSTEPL